MKKRKYFYIFTGRSRDVWCFISMMILNPAVVAVITSYITGKEVNLLLIYIFMDVFVLLYWAVSAHRRKRYLKKLETENWDRVIEEKLEQLEPPHK